MELGTLGSWSGVSYFRSIELVSQAVGVELVTSGSWSGVGDFRQLE